MLLLFAVILIFFGPKRLPQLSRSIGKAIHDFKRGLSDMKDDIERAGEDEEDQEPRAKVPPTVVEKSEGEAEKNVVAPPAHSKHV
ncbi:twin-arginine translocase TatA/TatE family subunit [bacterium]|nr:twin-arginine translocase TatA/TatE family subunit [bacterium]